MNRRWFDEDEPAPHCEVYHVSPRSATRGRMVPSETRDFAPTLIGWGGILAVTGGLAWLFWRLGGDDAGIGWLVTSVTLGYSVAAMGWTAIRRELDRREDCNCGSEEGGQ